MLNSDALEAAVQAAMHRYDDASAPTRCESWRAHMQEIVSDAVAAFLTASMPEDVKPVAWRFSADGVVWYFAHKAMHNWTHCEPLYDATTFASLSAREQSAQAGMDFWMKKAGDLSAKVEELERLKSVLREIGKEVTHEQADGRYAPHAADSRRQVGARVAVVPVAFDFRGGGGRLRPPRTISRAHKARQ